MDDLDHLFATFNVSPVFTREHDSVLLAAPFALVHAPTITPLHGERLKQVLMRGFLRSARTVRCGSLETAPAEGSTAHLTARMTSPEQIALNGPALLLTCAPNAHLALTLVLERDALFQVETVGRVIRRPEKT